MNIMLMLPTFSVRVTIENKQSIRDPEGETILQDLIRRHEYSDIVSVRTARLLRFKIDAPTQDDACKRISEMCADLRIYNPLVSDTVVESEL